MSLFSKLKNEQIINDILFVLHPTELFAVSKCGKVLGKTLRVLKLKTQGKYYIVSYQAENKKIRHKYVHRLVAEVFIDNPKNLPYVNHKDGNKLNNSIDNLEWCTPLDNSIHAINTGLTWNLPKSGQCGFRRKDDN